MTGTAKDAAEIERLAELPRIAYDQDRESSLSLPQLIEECARFDAGYAIANSLLDVAIAVRDAANIRERAMDGLISELARHTDALNEIGMALREIATALQERDR